MKLVNFSAEGRESVGALGPHGIVDLGARLGHDVTDALTFIRSGLMGPARSIAASGQSDYALDDVRILKPVGRDTRYFCIGVVVIGTGRRRIKQEAALSHVFGYTCGNEGSVRDWLRHSKFNVTQGKNFDRSGAIGPYLVSYLSTFCSLEPGDVIFSGTPSGAGARFDPPRYLVAGDVVEVEVSRVGVLRNTVVDDVG